MTDERTYAEPPEGGYRFKAAVIAGINRADPDDVREVTTYDITEILAVMYDTILTLDDVASGYLDGEELTHLAEIGRICGFKLPQCTVSERSTGSIYSADWLPGGACTKGIDHGGKHYRVINGYTNIPTGTVREW